MTINGLAPRGNPILGLSRYKENSTQIPYTTLIYGNGPGNHQPRQDPTIGPNSTDSPYYVQYAAIHQEEAFHDGSDVAVFASGPFAHLFQGVQEQSYIAHVFAYAMCIGDYTEQPHCRVSNNLDNYFNSGSNTLGADESTRRTTVINNPSLGRQESRLNPSSPAASTLLSKNVISRQCLLLANLLIALFSFMNLKLVSHRITLQR